VTFSAIHRQLLAAVPEVGPTFGLEDVFLAFGGFVIRTRDAGDRELVLRALGFLECLLADGPPEVAERAIQSTFRNGNWSSEWIARVGPRTRAALNAADWSV
jgi:hypothetical protein